MRSFLLGIAIILACSSSTVDREAAAASWVPVGTAACSGAACVQLHAGDKIAFPGDSITLGSVAAPWFTPFVSSLAPGYLSGYANLGHSGARVLDLQGVVSEVTSYAPNVVYIQVGVNDLASGSSLSTYKATCKTYINTIKTALPGVVVAWVGILAYGEQYPDAGAATLDAYNAAIRAACVETGAIYIDVRADQQAYEANYNTPAPGANTGVLCVDPTIGVHPSTSLGVPLMSARALAMTHVN